MNNQDSPSFFESEKNNPDGINRDNFNLPKYEQIAEKVKFFKDNLYKIGADFLLQNDKSKVILDRYFQAEQEKKYAAKVALATTSYNQTYPLSRDEALKIRHDFAQNQSLAVKIGLAASEIQKINITIPAINQAYFSLIQQLVNEDGWIVEDKEKLVPRQGFGIIQDKSIYFNSTDFYKQPEDFTKPQYDLHDFIHYAVGATNTKFASKYYPIYDENGEIAEAGLVNLPKELQLLITSKVSNEHKKSDGYILSTLTFKWFYEKFEQLGQPIVLLPNQQSELVKYVSEKLFEYLMSEDIHINPLELAVLMQNKLYEAGASECETPGFVRGGALTARGKSELDTLFDLDPIARIYKIAEIAEDKTARFHHEDRNTLRNRAQVIGYKKAAKAIQEILLERYKDGDTNLSPYIQLCNKIQSAGQKEGNVNLFHDVHVILKNQSIN